MKLLPIVAIISVILIISHCGQCHTPLSMARAVGRFIGRPFRTIARFPLHVVSKVAAAKKVVASKLAFAMLVKGALLKKPLLVWKTIAGTKLVAKSVAASPHTNTVRGAQTTRSHDMQVPLELRMAPITIKSYFHTKGTRFDLSNRREQSVALKSSQSINQAPVDRSHQQQQQQQQRPRDSPMQALPRVTLV